VTRTIEFVASIIAIMTGVPVLVAWVRRAYSGREAAAGDLLVALVAFYARVFVSSRGLAAAIGRRARTRSVSAKTTMPGWALDLLDQENAERYAFEWGAHLFQLVEEGHLEEARADRRRLTRLALVFAIVLLLRRARARFGGR
jgi:predicted alpha/beta hydrolase family esterase